MEGMKKDTLPRMQLIIKEPWFTMIKDGIKQEEYRDIKEYYTSRFKNLGLIEIDPKRGPEPTDNALVVIEFKNGYAKDAPTMEKTCRLIIGRGMEEWGADPEKDYYVLSILEEDPDDNTMAESDNKKEADEYKKAELDAERDYNNSLVDDAKEYLDKFLSPNTCKDVYEREERYSPYGFEKAKKYVQTLYDIARR